MMAKNAGRTGRSGWPGDGIVSGVARWLLRIQAIASLIGRRAGIYNGNAG